MAEPFDAGAYGIVNTFWQYYQSYKKMKTSKIWIEIIRRVLQGEHNIVSPFAEDGIIESRFIIVQKDTGMGWGLIWCSKTHRGVYLSRMDVPGTVKSVFTEDFDISRESIPQIKFESF